jgi:hypothetical protein
VWATFRPKALQRRCRRGDGLSTGVARGGGGQGSRRRDSLSWRRDGVQGVRRRSGSGGASELVGSERQGPANRRDEGG